MRKCVVSFGDDIEATLPKINGESRGLVQQTLFLLVRHRYLMAGHRQIWWWPDEIVEEERAINKEREPEDLEEGDRENQFLPAKAETYDPDGKCPACVGERPSRGADVPSDAQSEEVEKRDADTYSKPRVQNCRCIDHLIPATGEVKEGRQCRDGGDGQDRNKHEN